MSVFPGSITTITTYLRYPIISARYINTFNATADELGVGIRLTHNNDQFVVASDNIEISDQAIWKVQDTIESERLRKVRVAFDHHDRIPYRAPLEKLTSAEQAAVKLFKEEIKPLIDAIEARQQDPNSQLLGAWMVHHGDYFSKILFDRFRRDVVLGPFSATEFSLFPFFPDPPPINGMISSRVSLDEILELGQQKEAKAEELRPTTVLSKTARNKIIATPLPRYSEFREDHRKLADALERIAEINIDESQLDPRLREQLIKWARFFTTGNAMDEATAVQSSINAAQSHGKLRIHIGPSESYWPDNTKFPYLLQVGIIEHDLISQLDETQNALLALESFLEDIPYYSPRALALSGHSIDPIYQIMIGGFIESFPINEPLGLNYPNYSGYDVNGSNRFVMLEGSEIVAGQIKIVMDRLLEDDLSQWNHRKYTRETTVVHESGHLVGPQRDHITPQGHTMGTVFGDIWASSEEPKADLAVIVQAQHLLDEGQISVQEAKDYIRGIIGFNLHRYKGKEAFLSDELHGRFYSPILQIGYYFTTGAMKLISITGSDITQTKIHVNYEQMANDAYELWRRIIMFQAAGNVSGFLDYGKQIVAAIPTEADKLILGANKDQKPFFIERHL